MTGLKEVFHVAVPTAFDQEENLDCQATLAHIAYLMGKSIRLVLVSGSTGEQHSLTLSEKQGSHLWRGQYLPKGSRRVGKKHEPV